YLEIVAIGIQLPSHLAHSSFGHTLTIYSARPPLYKENLMFCKPYLKAKTIIRLILLVAVVAAVAIIPWANPSISSATAITVTNTNDNGPGSLRQAIIDAVSGDIINFNIPASDPGCTGGLCTITLASELAIEKSLTIQGPGANQLTVSGNH